MVVTQTNFYLLHLVPAIVLSAISGLFWFILLMRSLGHDMCPNIYNRLCCDGQKPRKKTPVSAAVAAVETMPLIEPQLRTVRERQEVSTRPTGTLSPPPHMSLSERIKSPARWGTHGV